MAERGFIRVQPPKTRSGLLDVSWQGRAYRFVLQTAHVNERRVRLPRRGSEHVHDVYHVVLFTEGENRFQYRGRAVPSQPGTIILAGPGESHDFGPLDGGETSYHEITFDLTAEDGTPLRLAFVNLLELYVGEPLPKPASPFVLPPRELQNASLLYERLMDRVSSTQAGADFAVQRIVLELLARLVQELFLPLPGADVPPAGVLQRAKDSIDIHYARPQSVAGLARQAHVSKEHFCRAFKARFGQSPMAYRQERRIAAACNLLRSTDLLCKEIAARLGYADVYGFSRAFRKIVGRSPRSYRRPEPGD
jgi:AraC-like DNA-binding protein/quercetin dioxygenase-like cupin family protein